MNETAIEWTDATWNPMSGCEVISEGCKFCYAKTLAEAKRGTAAFPNGFDLTIRPHKLNEPKRLKTPSMIFVNSMSDLFWEQVDDAYRDRIFDVMEECPQHEFQALTKRPENLLRYSKRRKIPSNVWVGATVESNRVIDRVDIIRQVDAEIRFLSVEPLLSNMDGLDTTGIQWVITGGESGLHLSSERVCERRGLVAKDSATGKWYVRDDRADWVRQVRDECLRTGTAFIHKQWGGLRPKSCGRELDGRVWDEYPRKPGHSTTAA